MLYKPKQTFFVRFLKGLLVKKLQLRAVLACAESNFSKFKFEYLCENEFLRKTIVAKQGDQMGSINEKKIEVKNLVTLPL